MGACTGGAARRAWKLQPGLMPPLAAVPARRSFLRASSSVGRLDPVVQCAGPFRVEREGVRGAGGPGDVSVGTDEDFGGVVEIGVPGGGAGGHHRDRARDRGREAGGRGGQVEQDEAAVVQEPVGADLASSREGEGRSGMRRPVSGCAAEVPGG